MPLQPSGCRKSLKLARRELRQILKAERVDAPRDIETSYPLLTGNAEILSFAAAYGISAITSSASEL